MKKWAAWMILLALIPALSGCGGRSPVKDNGDPTDDPELTGGFNTGGLGSLESFSFSLEWGGHGESYDSSSGVLKKETRPAEHNPGDYIAIYLLTEEQKQQIYDLLTALDVTSYPNIYDPQMGGLTSFPGMTLILAVRTDSIQKTITARNIAWRFTSEDAKGQAFLSACKTIIDLLEQTEEWQALPEYDYFLD